MFNHQRVQSYHILSNGLCDGFMDRSMVPFCLLRMPSRQYTSPLHTFCTLGFFKCCFSDCTPLYMQSAPIMLEYSSMVRQNNFIVVVCCRDNCKRSFLLIVRAHCYHDKRRGTDEALASFMTIFVIASRTI